MIQRQMWRDWNQPIPFDMRSSSFQWVSKYRDINQVTASSRTSMMAPPSNASFVPGSSRSGYMGAPGSSNRLDSEMPRDKGADMVKLNNKRCKPPKILPSDQFLLSANGTITIEMHPKERPKYLSDECKVYPLNARNTDVFKLQQRQMAG